MLCSAALAVASNKTEGNFTARDAARAGGLSSGSIKCTFQKNKTLLLFSSMFLSSYSRNPYRGGTLGVQMGHEVRVTQSLTTAEFERTNLGHHPQNSGMQIN